MIRRNSKGSVDFYTDKKPYGDATKRQKSIRRKVKCQDIRNGQP